MISKVDINILKYALLLIFYGSQDHRNLKNEEDANEKETAVLL